MAIVRKDEFVPADRYLYDFGQCSAKNGFAQIDTSQDAPYFGTWANPYKRIWCCYCEGDTTFIQCDTDEEFVAEIRENQRWNQEMGFGYTIDAYGHEEKWKSLGLGDLLG